MPFTVVPNSSASSGGIATADTNWTCRYQSTTMTSPSPHHDRAVRGNPMISFSHSRPAEVWTPLVPPGERRKEREDEGAGGGVPRAETGRDPRDGAPRTGPGRGRDQDRLLGDQPGNRAVGHHGTLRSLRPGLLRVLPLLAGLSGRRRRRGLGSGVEDLEVGDHVSRWARTSWIRTTSTRVRARPRIRATSWHASGVWRVEPRSISPPPRCSTWRACPGTASG